MTATDEEQHRRLYRLVPPDHVRSDPDLHEILDSLLEEGGSAILAILLFGSRLVGSDPDRHSAYDLVLVVDRYSTLYQRLAAAKRLHRSPSTFTILSHILPPTNISYRADPGAPALAKCMIASKPHLESMLSTSAPDHFCLGRLIHRVALVHARGPEVEEDMIGLVARARRTTLSWVAPFIEEPFSLADFTRTMFGISFRGEIRPESQGRPAQVAESQDRFLALVYGRLLETACRTGVLVRGEGGYRYANPPSLLTRLRWWSYFRWSGVRSTVRWFKHMLTFEEWLDYIQRKVERRMGLEIEIDERDRKYPLIFLWPKLFRVLRARKEGRSDA